MTRIISWRGFGYPFFDGRTVMRPSYNEELVKNDILHLLLTLPSERRNLPGWGCELRRIVFEPGDDNTAQLIRQSIISAITRYETRVAVQSVDVAWRDLQKAFSVVIVTVMRADAATRLSFNMLVSETGVKNVR